MSADPAHVIGQVISGFLIDRHLGSGAAGHVYRATRDSEEFAIKFYRDSLFTQDEQAADARIAREVDLREIRHPNLCRIVESGAFGESAPKRFLAMEFVDGPNLTEEIEENGPLTWDRFRDFGGQLVDAVRVLHAHSFVHRDIKPDNILIEKGTGRLVLGDFGVLGKLFEYDTTITGTNEFLGTLRYSAREWVLREPPEAAESPAIDVYSIGATSLQMMTGVKPFPATSNSYQIVVELVRGYRHNVRGNGYPKAAENLVRLMLNPDPNLRPTLDDFAKVLETDSPSSTSDPTDPVTRLAAALSVIPAVTTRAEQEERSQQRERAFRDIRSALKGAWIHHAGGSLNKHPLQNVKGISTVAFEDAVIGVAIQDQTRQREVRMGPPPSRTDPKRLDNVHDLVTTYSQVDDWDHSFGVTVSTYPNLVGGGVYYVVDVGHGSNQVTVLRILVTFIANQSGGVAVDHTECWVGTLQSMIETVEEDVPKADHLLRELLAQAAGA